MAPGARWVQSGECSGKAPYWGGGEPSLQCPVELGLNFIATICRLQTSYLTSNPQFPYLCKWDNCTPPPSSGDMLGPE